MAQQQKQAVEYFAVGTVSFTSKATRRKETVNHGEKIDPVDDDFESLMALGAITDKKPEQPKNDQLDPAGDEGLEEL